MIFQSDPASRSRDGLRSREPGEPSMQAADGLEEQSQGASPFGTHLIQGDLNP